MRRLVLAALAAFALSLPAAAQNAASPESQEAARALVEAMGMREQVGTMLGQMRGLLVQSIQQQSPNAPQGEAARVVDEFLMPEFQARSGEIAEATAEIWAARLTAAELRELAAFYATPLGRKLLGAIPEVTAEALRFGQAWGARVAGEAIAKHRAALRARGFNL